MPLSVMLLVRKLVSLSSLFVLLHVPEKDKEMKTLESIVLFLFLRSKASKETSFSFDE